MDPHWIVWLNGFSFLNAVKLLCDRFWETRILSFLNALSPTSLKKKMNFRLGKLVRKRSFHLRIFTRMSWWWRFCFLFVHLNRLKKCKILNPKRFNVSFLHTFQLRKGKLFIFQNMNNIQKMNWSNFPPNCIVLGYSWFKAPKMHSSSGNRSQLLEKWRVVFPSQDCIGKPPRTIVVQITA